MAIYLPIYRDISTKASECRAYTEIGKMCSAASRAKQQERNAKDNEAQPIWSTKAPRTISRSEGSVSKKNLVKTEDKTKEELEQDIQFTRTRIDA